MGGTNRVVPLTLDKYTIYGYVGNLNASTHREREAFCQKVKWLFGFEKAF